MPEQLHAYLAASSSGSGRSRPLAVFIALSVAVHVWALLMLPGDMREAGRIAQVQALEVVLIKPEPPPAVLKPDPPSAAPAVQSPQPARKSAVIARPKPRYNPEPGPVDSSPVAVEATTPASVPVASPQPAVAVAESPSSPKDVKVNTAATEPLVAPSFNAAYLRNPAPRYPLVARRNGEQGTVTLRVLVNRDGLPASVDIERTSGFPPLDNAAREAVRSWRFAPARRGAQAVEAWVLVPIVFRLEDA